MITSLLALALVAQDPGAASVSEPETRPSSVGELEGSIHAMRLTLIAGGDKVREAEAQALEFYERKGEKLAERADEIAADLTEKGAEYDVALERVLAAGTPAARKAAAAEALKLRNAISALDAQAADVAKRRSQFVRASDLVRDRGRERERLASQLDTPGESNLIVLPLPEVGLGPRGLPGDEPGLDDPGLAEDLLSRDPQRARRILFELDPAAYWRRWPLRPPSDALREALPFPLPDLPGNR